MKLLLNFFSNIYVQTNLEMGLQKSISGEY